MSVLSTKVTQTKTMFSLEVITLDFINRMVGVPYKFLGTDYDGFDCIGAMKIYYRERGWPLVESDGKPIDPDWYEKDKYRLARYFIKHFNRVTDVKSLIEGDVIMFEINSEAHTGIMIDNYGRFLSTFPPLSKYNGGCSFVDKLKFWLNMRGVRFISGFRRKE